MNFFNRGDASHLVFYRDDLNGIELEGFKRNLQQLLDLLKPDVTITLNASGQIGAHRFSILLSLIRSLTEAGKSVRLVGHPEEFTLLTQLGIHEILTVEEDRS